ncbi:uncharacterized protein LOC128245813 [Mya arenaria]|uniref:uncharacterized protein LOC128245813 n=1 Tax=Mya arenaria TaxID=6604 RepID=UPI0022E95B17|nr:uncharacterized protein LOC128245813 [Mya arenaria]
MASKQIQCEMCGNENAVGNCKSCGYVGEACVDIHKSVNVFQTHTVIMHEAVKMHEDGTDNPNVILRDITEERCEQHPNEKAIFLCKIHDSTMCGRCVHSGHRPCGEEVVDLLNEVVNIDCERVNTMKSLLMEIKDEILLLKNEAEHSKENYKKNADKCVQECMGFENKIKQRVHELTSGIRDGITKKHNENLTIHSHITKLCDEKTKIQTKHTFKGFDFKENKVILKCVFEDLEEVCEHQEEVTGSDDGNANDVGASTTKINQTRRELTVLLSQIKQDLDQSEKARNALCDELKQVKQDKDNSEKKRQILEQELLKAKQGIEESEKTRKGFEQELLKAKQCIEKYEKEKAVFKKQIPHLKDNIKWTQPIGTVEVKNSKNEVGLPVINLSFTFPDGIQTTHHASLRSPYKGGTFMGYLRTDTEGELLCRMLKAAFRRGLMFNLGKEGKVVLDGVSLYNGPVYTYLWIGPNYDRYIQTLKAELSAKGITETNIDQTEKLYETLTVDGR